MVKVKNYEQLVQAHWIWVVLVVLVYVTGAGHCLVGRGEPL
jgi:hypothetical protein